jgi:hypothetical protein
MNEYIIITALLFTTLEETNAQKQISTYDKQGKEEFINFYWQHKVFYKQSEL